MAVSYDRLWHLLIDKHMSKSELIRAAKISTNAMAHLGKNEDVRVEVLVKICKTLDCTMDDIMEIIPDQAGERMA
jgi:DNA (cytosine-5)-methyltransferase 1